MNESRRTQSSAMIVLLVLLYTFPLYGSQFFLLTIGVQTFFMAIMAMGLIFLAGFGGMLSLAQTSLYGVSAYTFALLSVRSGWPWPLAALAALVAATLVAFLFGLIAVRTHGINFLMITLAQAMFVYYFAIQSRDLLGGMGGINGVRPAPVAGISVRDPATVYLIALTAALLVYLGLRYLARTPFGLAIQAIRDNPRRMRSLGFNVTMHRVAVFTLGGLLSGIAGVLGVWYYAAISPGSIDLIRSVNVLVIAVLGGLGYVEGGFVGALFFVLVTTFASSYTDRYNTLIGLSFLAVALFLPNGLTGLFAGQFRHRPGAAAQGQSSLASSVPATEQAAGTPGVSNGQGI